MNGGFDSISPHDRPDASAIRGALLGDGLGTRGVYRFVNRGPIESRRDEYVSLRREIARAESARLAFWRRARLPSLRSRLAEIPIETKWRDTIHNVVVTVGKNKILDEALAGSAYTATWYMGLISAVSYTTGPVAGDTMASHGGWTEAGPTNVPNYSQANRITTVWSASAAGAKNLSSALTFSISSGTNVVVKGAFVSSNNSKDGTTGILLSAGAFSGGDKTVSNGDSLAVSYSMTLT
jgi:hypothetical protein